MCKSDDHFFQKFDETLIYCVKCGMFKYKTVPVTNYYPTTTAWPMWTKPMGQTIMSDKTQFTYSYSYNET